MPEHETAKQRRLKKVLGLVGLVIAVVSFIVKDIIRDRHKDFVDAITAAKPIFLLKSDTGEILDQVWEIGHPPQGLKPGNTAFFTIRQPLDSDTQAYLDSALNLADKLPNHEELIKRIDEIRTKNNELVQGSQKIFAKLPQNIVKRYPFRVDIAFSDLSKELEFRNEFEPMRQLGSEIRDEVLNLGKDLIREADERKESEERSYQVWLGVSYFVALVGAVLTLIAILMGVDVDAKP